MPSDHPLLRYDFHAPFITNVSVCDFDPSAPPDFNEVADIHTIRYARPPDVSRIAYLADLVWRGDASRVYASQVDAMFHVGGARGGPAYFVTETGGELTGFSGVRPSWMMPNAFEFTGVTVHPKWQGLGIGRILTEARLELVKALGGNYVLIGTIKPGFFERFDFEAIDANPVGWVVMKHIIDPDRRYFHG